MKLKPITLSELLAVNVPYESAEIVKSFGEIPSKKPEGLIAQLDKLTVRYREDFLNKLAEIHPHRDLILASVAPAPVVAENASTTTEKTVPVEKAVEKAPETTTTATPKVNNNDITKYAVIGMAGLLLGILIYQNK